MEKDLLSVCNFDKILSQLASKTFFQKNANSFYNIDKFDYFFSDKKKLEEHHEFVSIFSDIISNHGEFSYINDISYIFDKRFGLSLDQICQIRNFILSLSNIKLKLKSYFDNHDISSNAFEEIKRWSYEISSHDQLLKELDYYLDNGQIKDSIPELRNIKKSIQSTNNAISNYTKTFLKSNKEKLNLENITLKDNRVAFGIKSSFKNDIDGFVISSSNSKDTVFFESYQLRVLNNDLENFNNEYKIAISKIISKLSNLILKEDTLKDDFINLQKMDIFYTYALFFMQNNLSKVDVGPINLIQIKPFLKNSNPIDIRFFDSRVVVLSGANAGGKSVALKTLGLAALMQKSGMYLFCSPDSSLPLFFDIDIVIGDNQDSQNSLSSFTSHIKAISKSLKNMDNKLILIDEICFSTSEKEGSAIACAVLDEIVKTNSYGFVSTHYDSIKFYALKKENVQNACVNFNKEKLIPDFSISYGLPSSSYAIDIAKSIGFDKAVIENSYKYIDDKYLDIVNIIKNLNSKQNDLEKQIAESKKVRQELELKSEELLERQKENEIFYNNIKEKELNLKSKTVFEYTQKLQSHEKELKFFEKEKKAIFQELKKIEDEKIQKIKTKFKIGDSVKILKNGKNGEIIGIKNNSYIVEIGILKVNLKAYEIVLNEKEKTKISYKVQSNTVENINIDLRGKRLQECLSDLDYHINRLLTNGISNFYIIHGIGEGILKKGIHEYLSRCSFIKKYNLANFDDGGDGKTYVDLK